jgi:uncharacterized protein (TIGR03435 family)
MAGNSGTTRKMRGATTILLMREIVSYLLIGFIVALIFLRSQSAIAQTQSQGELAQRTQVALPAFEVASIRIHQGPLHVEMGFSSSGSLLNLEGYSVRELIMEAYNLKTYQLDNAGLDWQMSTSYDVAARAEDGTTPTRDEFRKMLQTLLVERFNFKFHREQKEMPVYAMIVEKGGPKFKESANDEVFAAYHGVNGRNQNLSASHLTMESLANEIGNTFFVNRPVIDRTGLSGTYDFKIEATPEFRHNRDPQPEDISVFSAIREQLGLKLDPQKANIAVLIVDHIEKVSEN